MEMTKGKIIVFGDYEQRYGYSKKKVVEVNDNLVLDMDWSEFVSYKIDVISHKN